MERQIKAFFCFNFVKQCLMQLFTGIIRKFEKLKSFILCFVLLFRKLLRITY